MQQAAKEKAKANEQHHSEGYLENDQKISRTPRSRASYIPCCIFQTLGQMRAGCLQRRDHAEEKSGQKGNSQTDGEDAAIYPQISAGHESRRGFADDVRTPLRDKHAQPSAAKQEKRALGQQLANHSASRAAQGGAHGDFSLALQAASEKEATNIGASDQE